MVLDVRANAIKIAVLSFFALSIIGICCGLTPYTVCVRAIICAFVVYVVSAITIKVINVVLLDAIISKFLNRQGRQKNEPEY